MKEQRSKTVKNRDSLETHHLQQRRKHCLVGGHQREYVTIKGHAHSRAPTPSRNNGRCQALALHLGQHLLPPLAITLLAFPLFSEAWLQVAPRPPPPLQPPAVHPVSSRFVHHSGARASRPSLRSTRSTPWFADGQSGEGSESTPLSSSAAADEQTSPREERQSREAPSSTIGAGIGASTSGVMAEAAEIMASRGETDLGAARRAYLMLDAERKATTTAASAAGVAAASSRSSSELTRSTAAALLSWIRSSTDGNGLVVADDGGVSTSDTAERQALWAEHAPTVLQLVEDVGTEPGLDPELQQLYTEAVMYSVASGGIIKAFVSGKAVAFTSAMKVLVNKFPTHDNGVAFIFQGSYYLAAPWPVRSTRKAQENFDKAVKINGRSRRNVYYAGLARLACGDREGAAEMFRRSISDEHCESASATERDIAAALRKQSKRGLDFCEGRTG